MDKTEYAKLLKDPLWQAKRLEILERDGNKCTICGRTNYLQVHHKFYEPILPWEYKNEDLITHCMGCHKDWHRKNGNTYRNYVTRMSVEQKFDAIDSDGKYIVNSLFDMTSSKKIIDLVKENDPDGTFLFGSMEQIIFAVFNILDVQDKGHIKINSKSTGGFEMDMNITITYKSKSKIPENKYERLKQKYPNDIKFAGKTLVFLNKNISQKKMKEIYNEFAKKD